MKPGLKMSLAGLGFLGVWLAPPLKADTPPSHAHGTRSGHVASVGPGEAPHHHAVDPARLKTVDRVSHPADRLPPPVNSTEPRKIDIHLEVREVVAPLASGVRYVFWTYEGTVPGPMIRAREGDTVRLTLVNHHENTHDHSIDLHAVTGPGGGAAYTQVKPGEQKTIRFVAKTPGVFLYHCGTPNIPTHLANGLYGLMVVDPKSGWPRVDREFYLVQGEFYTAGPVAQPGLQPFAPEKLLAEQPEYIVWNGGVRALSGNQALRARRGERVRLFIGNAGVSKILNFHIIGEILDRVYPQGAGNVYLESVQTTPVPAGGAVVVELELDNAGTYLLVDHALARIDRGAYGHLVVEGEPDATLLEPVPGPSEEGK